MTIAEFGVLPPRNICATTTLLVTLLMSACTLPKSQTESATSMPPPVVLAVQQAKKEGRKTTSVSTTVDSARNTSLSEELADSSVLVVTPKRLAAAVTTDNAFVTWTVFSIEREVGEQSIRPDACFDQVPSSLQLSGRDLAVGFLGGVMEVDGVTVTWGSADSQLDLTVGERYVLFGVRCSARQLQTRNPGYSLAELTASDELRPLTNQSESVYPAFFKELMELRNLTALQERARKKGGAE